MKGNGAGRDGDRGAVRDALRRAPGSPAPDVTRLLEAVPGLMAEARRRREAPPPDLASALAAHAWRAIPKLAATTAAALVLAGVLSLVGEGGSSGGAGGLDSTVLAGGEDHTGSDILLDAVLDLERSDG